MYCLLMPHDIDGNGLLTVLHMIVCSIVFEMSCIEMGDKTIGILFCRSNYLQKKKKGRGMGELHWDMSTRL